MAIGKKSGGRNFKKGQSGNPDGRPPLPPEVRAARAINQIEFEKIANRLFGLNSEELASVVQSPSTTVFEMLIAKQMLIAAVTGDQRSFETIFVRTIGKVKTEVEAGLTEEERAAQKKIAQGGEKGAVSFSDLALKAKLAKDKAGGG